MNRSNNLDKLLRDVARSGKMSPPDDTWMNIVAELDDNKRKRTFLLPVLLGCIGLSFIVLSFYYIYAGKYSKSPEDHLVFKEIEYVADGSEAHVKQITGTDKTFAQDPEYISASASSFLLSDSFSIKLADEDDWLSMNDDPVLMLPGAGIRDGLPEEDKDTYDDLYDNEKPATERYSDVMHLEKLPAPVYFVQYKLPLHIGKNDSEGCPDFKQAAKPSLFINIFGGGGIPHKSMETFSVENSTILELRNQTETPWYIWTVGGMTGIQFGNNLSLSSGVQFVQIKDKFYFEEEGVKKFIVTYHADGSPIDTIFITGRNIEIGEVRYSLTDIPVMIGYGLELGNQWRIRFDAGPVFNLFMRSSGKIMTGTNEVSRRENMDLYHRSVGLGLAGGFGIERKLGEGSVVYLKPNIRYNLHTWNLESNNIHLKYNSFMINIGYKKYF